MSDPSRLHPPGPAWRCSVHVWLNERKRALWAGAVASVAIGQPSPAASMASSLGGGAGVSVTGWFHVITLCFSPVSSAVYLGDARQ